MYPSTEARLGTKISAEEMKNEPNISLDVGEANDKWFTLEMLEKKGAKNHGGILRWLKMNIQGIQEFRFLCF